MRELILFLAVSFHRKSSLRKSFLVLFESIDIGARTGCRNKVPNNITLFVVIFEVSSDIALSYHVCNQ